MAAGSISGCSTNYSAAVEAWRERRRGSLHGSIFGSIFVIGFGADAGNGIPLRSHAAQVSLLR
jgi:hypothetical protein